MLERLLTLGPDTWGADLSPVVQYAVGKMSWGLFRPPFGSHKVPKGTSVLPGRFPPGGPPSIFPSRRHSTKPTRPLSKSLYKASCCLSDTNLNDLGHFATFSQHASIATCNTRERHICARHWHIRAKKQPTAPPTPSGRSSRSRDDFTGPSPRGGLPWTGQQTSVICYVQPWSR